jgi:hypothetical protein
MRSEEHGAPAIWGSSGGRLGRERGGGSVDRNGGYEGILGKDESGMNIEREDIL